MMTMQFKCSRLLFHFLKELIYSRTLHILRQKKLVDTNHNTYVSIFSLKLFDSGTKIVIVNGRSWWSFERISLKGTDDCKFKAIPYHIKRDQQNEVQIRYLFSTVSITSTLLYLQIYHTVMQLRNTKPLPATGRASHTLRLPTSEHLVSRSKYLYPLNFL
jgi:hypothetical protein